MRLRFALALMVAGMLFAAGIASAQSTTTTNTDTLSGYTNTTTAETVSTTKSKPAPAVNDEAQAAPAVAAQPAGSAPSNLAFTGGDPLLLIVLGIALAGGTATLLLRDRGRSSQER